MERDREREREREREGESEEKEGEREGGWRVEEPRGSYREELDVVGASMRGCRRVVELESSGLWMYVLEENNGTNQRALWMARRSVAWTGPLDRRSVNMHREIGKWT